MFSSSNVPRVRIFCNSPLSNHRPSPLPHLSISRGDAALSAVCVADWLTMIFCIFFRHIGHFLAFSAECEAILNESSSFLDFSELPSSSTSSPASSQMPLQVLQWSISTPAAPGGQHGESASSSVIIAFLQTGQSISKLKIKN